MTNSPKSRRFVLREDAFPDISLMMLVTLDALRALGGSATIREILDYTIENEGVTEAEQSYLMPNGRDRRLDYYLSWSRTYLKRGGAVENSARGVWALTEAGEKIRSLAETRGIRSRVYEEERQRAKLKRSAEKADAPTARSDEDPSAPLSEEEHDEAWRDRLLFELQQLAADSFERLTQRLLREAGFVKVEVRGKTGDGGIDGVGVLRVNLITFQVYFQCKKWSNSVGAKDIRDFRGALQGRADKGLFVTTSSFTKQASDEAARDGAIAIDLIDGQRLCDLMK
ncbi:MAG: restriction endonuclease [Hyphomicrobiales bacterium]